MKNIFLLFIITNLCNLAFAQSNINYSYDNLNRIIHIDYSNGTVIEYTYDANGNRTTHVVASQSVKVQAKIFLEGPYDTENNQMDTSLNSGGYLQTTSPYSENPRTVTTIPENVVDWVLVQLRSTADGAAVTSRSAFLHKDGRIVADDGTTGQITAFASSGDYYIVIKHRNHLAVMSANPISLSNSSSMLYNFTTGLDKYYGNDAKLLEMGVYGLYTGDANSNGQVQNDDKNDYWKVEVGTAGYKGSDFNLNGQVQNDDKNDFWKNNVGKGTQVPESG